VRRDWIEEYLIDWIDMDYAPEHYSEAQLDELTARWIADHMRRANSLSGNIMWDYKAFEA
jgi:hypothetical protein